MTDQNPNRSDRGTVGNRLSDDERHVLDSNMRWGSDMYPVRKVRRSWILDPIRSVKVPGVYKTKREAVAAFERHLGVLVDASGQEAYERAVGLV